MTMGVEPMQEENWIEIDCWYEDEMAKRLALLDPASSQRDVVLQSLPEAREACLELLDELSTFLPAHFPDMFEKHCCHGVLDNLVTGESFDVQRPDMDPLEICARLVQEDLCVLVPRDGELVFGAGAVLFPSGWSLAEKIGTVMDRVHQPVPMYLQELSMPVNAFLQRLTPERPFWRVNWSVKDTAVLYQPATELTVLQAVAGEGVGAQAHAELAADLAGVPVEQLGDRLFLRCERETLRRLPRTRAVIFTIRTHTRPLSVLAGRPADAQRLLDAAMALPEELVRYKSMTALVPYMTAYLQSIVSVAQPTAAGLVA